MSQSTQSCLVIPDVHQNIDWVDAILNKEASTANQVIFLGDYFDAKLPSAANPIQTARYFSSLPNRFETKFTFLVGNHDLPYLYDLQNEKPNTSDRNPYTNGAYAPELSPALKTALSKEFIAALQPFSQCHGWILSHAGIHINHLSFDMDRSPAGLDLLYRELKTALHKLSPRKNPALAGIGPARGGQDTTGGITWLDWIQEFADTFDQPQIVGHTLLDQPSQKGRSWNIDTRAGHYVLLSPNGLEIRSIPKER